MINDIKVFKEQFFNFVNNEKIKLLDNKIKFDFLKIFDFCYNLNELDY